MTLVIEDGSGKADGESFASAADLAGYAVNYGAVVPADVAAQEALLRRAVTLMQVISWAGSKVSPTQPLPWPRADVEIDGATLPSDSIPERVRLGQMALAVEIHADDIAPPDQQRGAVVRERVEGVVERQYADLSAVSKRKPGTKPSQAQFSAYLQRRGLFATRA